MAVAVVMPRLGWTMETGRIAEWLKRDGDTVKTGENLLAVESDKAVIEVEALANGILRLPPDAPGPDVDIPVGTTIAFLVEADEAAPWEGQSVSPVAASDTLVDLGPAPIDDAEPVLQSTPSGAIANGDGAEPPISPRARRIARELGVEWTGLTGSGRSGRIVERDIRAHAARPASAMTVRATPVARRVAAATGVDIDQLAASLGGKRVARADVEAAASGVAQATPAIVSDQTGTPLSPVRRIIARRMSESAHTTAPVTLTTEADATELVELRNRIKAEASGQSQPIPSYTDFMIRIVALALGEHPALNATLLDDTIITHTQVHIGVAVDGERGLLVPVVRDVAGKSLGQIAAASARLIDQARSGRVAPEELQGGTFTITNLGMFEIDTFTPIINLPECAILGLGRIVPRLQVVDEATEKVAVRKMMALSLTFDHRVVDGAPAARFLQAVKRGIERPYAWVAR